MINIKGILTSIIVITGISILFPLSYYFSSKMYFDDEEKLRIQSIFSTEDEYINHIVKNVTFDVIALHIIEVKRGDNFWKIAKKYGVNIDTLIGSNPYWETLIARVKQHIVVPSRKGVIHFINNFDEIKELVELYKTTPDAIVVQNLPPLYRYYYKFFGDIGPIAVFIKGAHPITITMTKRMAKQFRLREMFRSPLGGRFSSFFGGRIHPIFRTHRFHNGVDIAARYGTLVGAACRGTVVSIGWMGGYGKTVIISHPNGFRTLYGHLSRIYVRRGQHVHSGKIIGRVGSTGWSTGPHLHFTIWHNGKLINPMKVLW
jgi:murein DD-endopeptidase MepM/ murein hydrolase activator NlpD